MNLRRKVLLLAIVMVVVLGLCAVLVSRYEPERQLMYCGHSIHTDRRSLKAALIGGRVNSICRSRDVVMRLQLLAKSDILDMENMLGEPSATNANSDYLQGLKCFLQTNGGGWTVTVPQQSNMLAGHYLLTSAGRLHFHQTRPATTNDFVLQDWSQ